MLLPIEPARQIWFPVDAPRPARSTHIREAAALRQVGCRVEFTFVDASGAPISEKSASRHRNEIEPLIREFSRGRKNHAQHTIAKLKAAQQTPSEQVETLLQSVYRAHGKGEHSKAVLGLFFDTVQTWLKLEGIAKMERLFEQIDLDRVPESLGIVLLATTRLTAEHFQQREAFFTRLTAWFCGRGGRTSNDVDVMLRGLRQ